LSYQVLTDTEVERYGDMSVAIAAVEGVMRDKMLGRLDAPARHHVDFGKSTELIFSVGRSSESVVGFRAYFSRAGRHFPDRVVAVWDAGGSLQGVLIGQALGVLRMGAIGGVAIKLLANPEADTIAILGSGRQARSHLEAAVVVRTIRRARVYSRDPQRCQDFAKVMSRRLQVDIRPESSAQRAVEGAQIVVVATSSLTPVVSAGDFAPGAFVHTVGLKSPVAKELDIDVADRAGVVVTDSTAQAKAFGSRFILSGTIHMSRLVDLSAIVAGVMPFRSDPTRLTVCYPLGLTGTDVATATAVIQLAPRK
jgi:ornithine cyclodeaminase